MRFYLQLGSDHGVIVDHLSDHVEELDDLFGHVVAGRGLASNHNGTGHEGGFGVRLDPENLLLFRHPQN